MWWQKWDQLWSRNRELWKEQGNQLLELLKIVSTGTAGSDTSQNFSHRQLHGNSSAFYRCCLHDCGHEVGNALSHMLQVYEELMKLVETNLSWAPCLPRAWLKQGLTMKQCLEWPLTEVRQPLQLPQQVEDDWSVLSTSGGNCKFWLKVTDTLIKPYLHINFCSPKHANGEKSEHTLYLWPQWPKPHL